MAVDMPFPEEQIPPMVTATVLNAPVSAGDALYVNIPSLATNKRRQANWTPHGTTLPVAGTSCLVGMDEENQVWVLVWL